MDGLVSASDVRHVALALLIVLRAGAMAVETQKKPAAAGGEQSGLVQCQTWPMIPLSVPECRRFLWRLVLALQQTTVLSVDRKCIRTTLPGAAEREPGWA